MSLKIQNKKIPINQNLKNIYSNENFNLLGNAQIHKVELKNEKKFFYIGHIVFDKKKYKNLKNFLNYFIKKNKNILKAIEEIKNNLNGRFLIVYLDNKNSNLKIFSDLYGRYECFYHTRKNKLEIATDLSLFEVSPS